MMVSCRTVDARSRNSTRIRSSAGMVRAALRPYIVEGISIMWDNGALLSAGTQLCYISV